MPRIFLSEDVLKNNFKSLSEALPTTKLYYACKTNSDRGLLRLLNECGSNFDVATNGEIDILNELGISLNDQNSIHTHPIKSPESIDYAIANGVRTFVVDNEWEVIKLIGKECDVLIRVSFPNPNVKVDLSSKFGVAPDKFYDLYNTCVRCGVLVRGISFHVGSNCPTGEMHVRAIQQCLPWMQNLGLRTLDIGGGFPCFDGSNICGDIKSFCAPIQEVLEGCPFEVIAEPGRYIAATAMHMLTKIIGKALRGDTMWYYIDDGVYGMMSGVIYDHNEYDLIPIGTQGTKVYKSVFAGPTCDSIDVVSKGKEYPELCIGDEIFVGNIGAYSNATASTFNSLPLPIIGCIK